jgi:hypothetical protein
MQIFEQEINDGIADAVRSQACISYASIAQPCEQKPQSVTINEEFKSSAAINDSDLYYVQSILVSSSWNKNDDIFDKQEIWKARNTPEDKPTNLEHDENIIIGHITANWPITEDGEIIDESIDPTELPEKYHILTGSVIYKAFTSPELRARAENLIHEIETGQKFVSMECFFNNFDYGVIDNSTNKFKILARNNDTAYLTKHLRAYGGTGEHDNYKIGRVLRNITFSGKGFVDKPANPDSIIFPKKNNTSNEIKNLNFDQSGVSNIQSNSNVENNTMSLEKQVAELQEKLEAMSDCSQATKDAYAVVTELKDTVASLEKTITEKDAELATIKASLEDLVLSTEAAKKMAEEEMMKKDEEVKKAKSELEDTNEVLAGYKAKEAEMVKKEKKIKRMASLIESGLDNDLASSTVDKFENLDDDSFDSMAALLAALKPSMKKKDMMEEEEKAMIMRKKASENTDTEILETVEVENDVNLGVASEEDATESTRAALVEFVCHRLGKNLNKGE